MTRAAQQADVVKQVMRLSLAALFLFLAACSTPEQREAERMAQEQADIETCKSYGLHYGSENFGMCMLQLDLARQQYSNSLRYGYGGYYTPSHRRIGAGIGLGF